MFLFVIFIVKQAIRPISYWLQLGVGNKAILLCFIFSSKTNTQSWEMLFSNLGHSICQVEDWMTVKLISTIEFKQ